MEKGETLLSITENITTWIIKSLKLNKTKIRLAENEKDFWFDLSRNLLTFDKHIESSHPVVYPSQTQKV